MDQSLLFLAEGYVTMGPSLLCSEGGESTEIIGHDCHVPAYNATLYPKNNCKQLRKHNIQKDTSPKADHGKLIVEV